MPGERGLGQILPGEPVGVGSYQIAEIVEVEPEQGAAVQAPDQRDDEVSDAKDSTRIRGSFYLANSCNPSTRIVRAKLNR